jgi:hypothetical protein
MVAIVDRSDLLAVEVKEKVTRTAQQSEVRFLVSPQLSRMILVCNLLNPS